MHIVSYYPVIMIRMKSHPAFERFVQLLNPCIMSSPAFDADAGSSVDVILLLTKFIRCDVEAGEQLLEITACKDLCSTCSFPVFFEAVQAAVGSTTPKVSEIAIGIIANMVLCKNTCDEVTSELRVCDLVMQCINVEDDPYVLAATGRVLANLLYRKKADELLPHFRTLVSFVQFVVANSLSTHLLAQTYQLVYYIQIYGTPDMCNAWYALWCTHTFYEAALLSGGGTASYSSFVRTAVVELNTVLPALKGELLSGCTGLEWLLLSLDSYTLYRRNSDDASIDAGIAGICLASTIELLCSGRVVGWNADVAGSKRSAVTMSLNSKEKFLLVSILENVVHMFKHGSVDTDEPVEIVSHVQFLCGHHRTGSTAGFTVLLLVILEVGEESLLMKDASALNSVSFLLAALYSLDHTKQDTLVSTVKQHPYVLSDHVTEALMPVRNFVEMLALEDTMSWMLDNSIPQSSDLVESLEVLKELLKAHICNTSAGGEERVKECARLVMDIETILRMFASES